MLARLTKSKKEGKGQKNPRRKGNIKKQGMERKGKDQKKTERRRKERHVIGKLQELDLQKTKWA